MLGCSLLVILARLLPPLSGHRGGSRPGLVFQNPEHQFIATTVRVARQIGTSERTLARLFRTELGVTYPQWRALVRVLHAMALLSAGSSVTQTSHRCGWATPSAFIDTFTRIHEPDTRLLFRTTVSPPAPFPSRACGRDLRIHHNAPRQSTSALGATVTGLTKGGQRWTVLTSSSRGGSRPQRDVPMGGRAILHSSVRRVYPRSTKTTLDIAISEAVSMAVAEPSTRYALGSVLNHVLLHQSIIGEEALLQLAKVGETPACWSGAPVVGPTSEVSPSRSCARSWRAG